MPRPGRPRKDASERARNAGIVLYPDEIEAIAAGTRARRLKTSSEFVRTAVIELNERATRGVIRRPKPKTRSATPDRAPAPRTLLLPPV